MRISDWSSDVCSSDLQEFRHQFAYLGRRRAGVALYEAVDQSIDRFGKMRAQPPKLVREGLQPCGQRRLQVAASDKSVFDELAKGAFRSEEQTSELQSLMRRSYAVFCLKKKKSTRQKSQKQYET